MTAQIDPLIAVPRNVTPNAALRALLRTERGHSQLAKVVDNVRTRVAPIEVGSVGTVR
jgi:hypothetical protein